MAKSTNSDVYKCSFCGKTDRQVNRLIASAGGYICDECVKVCIEMVQSFKMKNFRTSYLPPPPPTPRKLHLLANAHSAAKKIQKFKPL